MLNKGDPSPSGSSQQIRRVDNPPREDEALAEGMNGRGAVCPFLFSAILTAIAY